MRRSALVNATFDIFAVRRDREAGHGLQDRGRMVAATVRATCSVREKTIGAGPGACLLDHRHAFGGHAQVG